MTAVRTGATGQQENRCMAADVVQDFYLPSGSPLAGNVETVTRLIVAWQSLLLAS